MTDEPTQTSGAPQVASPSVLQRKMKRVFIFLIIAAVLMTVMRFMGPPPLPTSSMPNPASERNTVPSPQVRAQEAIPPATPAVSELPPPSLPPATIDASNALEAKIAKLEAQLKEVAHSAVAEHPKTQAQLKQFQAFAQLQLSIALARPFKVDLERLLAASAGDETVLQLAAPLANITEIPSQRQLEDSFSHAIPSALKASTAPAQSGWVKHIQQHLSALVTLRRVREPEGSTIDAGLLAIQKALDAGDDAAALSAIAALDENARTAMSELEGQLTERTKAQNALNALQAYLNGGGL